MMKLTIEADSLDELVAIAARFVATTKAPTPPDVPMSTSIDALRLLPRTRTNLRHAGIYTVEGLCQKSAADLRREVGRISLADILNALSDCSLSLKRKS